MMRDPVCGMEVSAGSLTVEGHSDVGFCSEHCRSAFLADPDRYRGSKKADEGKDDGVADGSGSAGGRRF